jgi:hypothetical protein
MTMTMRKRFLYLVPLCLFLGFAACPTDTEIPDRETPKEETPEEETPEEEKAEEETPKEEATEEETSEEEKAEEETTEEETPEHTGVLVQEGKILFLLSGTETPPPYTMDPELKTGELLKSWASSNQAAAAVTTTGVVTPLAPGRTVITRTTRTGAAKTWEVLVVQRSPAANPLDLKNKFGVTAAGAAGVTATVNALHEFFAFLPEDIGRVVSPGDFINLEGFIPGSDGYGGFGGSFTPRAIVVGVNSFSGKNGNDTPHIVLHFQNLYGDGPMNTTATNEGGYGESAMRTYLQGPFLSGLTGVLGVPEARIWAPKRYVWNAAAGAAGAADLIKDKVWLPTVFEMFGESKTLDRVIINDQWVSLGDYENADNQVEFDYYQTNSRRKVGQSGSGGTFWLASPSPVQIGGGHNFYSMSTVGGQDALSSTAATTSWGVVPAFCIY